MTEPHKIWIEQCEAAEGIEDEFGTQQALENLVRAREWLLEGSEHGIAVRGS